MVVTMYATFPMIGWELTVVKTVGNDYTMAVAYNKNSLTSHVLYRYVNEDDCVEEPDPMIPQEVFDSFLKGNWND